MSEPASNALDGQHRTTEHPHLDRKKIGRQLIVAAWAIEILAALIGILIAVLVIVSTQQNIGEAEIQQRGHAAGIMNAFLGGLPFLVVAAVELTKIPLATACYHATSRLWKAILITGMFFLMVITFETILNGFERNFTQRTYVIKQVKKRLVSAEEEISKIEHDISDLSNITLESVRTNFDDETSQIAKTRQTELQEIEAEMQEVHKQYSNRETNYLARQKEQVEERLKALEVEFTQDGNRIETEYSEQRSQSENVIINKNATLQTQIDALGQEIERLRQLEREELSKIKDPTQNTASLNGEITRIEKDFTRRIDTARSDIISEKEETRREMASQIERIDKLNLESGAKIELRNSKEAFTARETIEKEVRMEYAPRIEGANKILVDLKRTLNELSASDVIIQLQNSKDEEIRAARQRFEKQGTSGDRKRELLRNKFSQDRVPKERQRTLWMKELSELNKQDLDLELISKRDRSLKALKDEYEKKRLEEESRRDDFARRWTEALESTEGNLQPALERVRGRRTEIVKRYDDIQAAARSRYDAAIGELEQSHVHIGSLRERLDGLAEDRLGFREDIVRYAEDSQIYRVASLWTGKDSAADVTNEELRVVSFIWFGSLAGITAWTGTLLAFAGLAVQFGRRPKKEELSMWPSFVRSLRRLIVTQRRLKLRPRERVVEKRIEIEKEIEIVKEIPIEKEVEVVREVPVEKIVCKEVEIIKEVPVDKVVFKEVPIEVTRKEIVYVPFLTDDPRYLKGQTTMERGIAGDLTAMDTRGEIGTSDEGRESVLDSEASHSGDEDFDGDMKKRGRKKKDEEKTELAVEE
jgi:hypothetical protein